MNLNWLRSSNFEIGINSFVLLALLSLSSFHSTLELIIRLCLSIRVVASRSTSVLIEYIRVKIFSCRDNLNRLFIVTLLLLVFVVVVMRSSIEVRDDEIYVVHRHVFHHLVHVNIQIYWFVVIVFIENLDVHEVMVILALLNGL